MNVTGVRGIATNDESVAGSVTTQSRGLSARNGNAAVATSAEVDKYIAELKNGQKLTIIYGLQKNTTLKVTELGPASYVGLVTDPRSGVRYRPGVVNIDPAQPPGTTEIHTINWGGYGSVQATPQPTQIIPYDPTNFVGPAVDAGEILILPAQDAPTQQTAQASSETVYTPAAPAIPLTGPVIAASRSNLVPSTDPLAAANVEFGRGLQPPSSDYLYGPNPNPSPTSATPPQTSFVGGTATALTGGTVTIEHVPIIDSAHASIVTLSANGTTTVDENSATTTAAELMKYIKGVLSRVTVSLNGTVTAYSSTTGGSKNEHYALDVTA